MYQILLRYPGIVVLHDYVLFHLFGGIAYSSKNYCEFEQIMEYCHGNVGLGAAQRYKKGVFLELEKFFFAVNKHIIDRSIGVIVHNKYSQRLINAIHPNQAVTSIPQFAPGKCLTNNDGRVKLRQKLGFRDDEIILTSIGFITPQKRIDSVLKMLLHYRAEFLNLKYILVGETVPAYDIRKWIDKYHLTDIVQITGFVDDATFQEYIEISDICINLRYPTAGETSATLIRCLEAGKPVLVSNYRQYAEFPDECCPKVDLSPDEVQSLYSILIRLINQSDLRKEMEQYAKQYIKSHYQINNVVEQYFDFIKSVAQRKPAVAPIAFCETMRNKIETSLTQDYSAIALPDQLLNNINKELIALLD
jgi:glycosyltransferase involved in cell wall biosynthesis